MRVLAIFLFFLAVCSNSFASSLFEREPITALLLTLIEEEDSCISFCKENRVYLDQTRIHLANHGFILETDVGFEPIDQVLYDQDGYYTPLTQTSKEKTIVSPDQIQVTLEEIFAQIDGNFIRVPSLISGPNGELLISNTKSCPPFTELCRHCLIACNPLWSKKCHACGRRL